MSLFSMNLRKDKLFKFHTVMLTSEIQPVVTGKEAVTVARFSGISQFFSRADFFFCFVFFVLDVFLLNGPCNNCKEMKH